MRKVVTPSRAEVQSTTIVVIATVFVFALYFGIVDYLVQHAMTNFLFKPHGQVSRRPAIRTNSLLRQAKLHGKTSKIEAADETKPFTPVL